MAVGIPEYRLPRDVLSTRSMASASWAWRSSPTAPWAAISRWTICSGEGIGPSSWPSARTGGRSWHTGRRPVRGVRRHHLPARGEPGTPGRVAAADQRPVRCRPLGKVAVIGGGNTAVDAARSALRLGAEERDHRLPPHACRDAGQPVGVDAGRSGGREDRVPGGAGPRPRAARVAAIECIRMALGEPDASGPGAARSRSPAVEFTVPVDTVIAAIGQSPEAARSRGVGDASGYASRPMR